MKAWQLVKSPMGNFALFVTLVAVGGCLIHRSNVRERARTAQLTMVENRPDGPIAGIHCPGRCAAQDAGRGIPPGEVAARRIGAACALGRGIEAADFCRSLSGSGERVGTRRILLNS